MVIDGGVGEGMLNCLSSFMPFYDRTIDIVMLTHPQADHLNGLVDVFARYEVGRFLTSPVGNDTIKYQELVDLVRKKNIPVVNLYRGDIVELGSVRFEIIWPDRQWLTSKLGCLDLQTCDLAALSSANVLGVSTKNNLNDFSMMGFLHYGSFDMLFTGDGDERIQDDIMATGVSLGENKLEVMKVPHHGSKTGLLEDFLKRFTPRAAIISAGRDNRYGHPDPAIVRRLSEAGSQVYVTSQIGTVVVTTDGRSWSVN